MRKGLTIQLSDEEEVEVARRVREALDKIDAVINEARSGYGGIPTEVGARVVAVLRMLRGPDEEDDQLKEQTTGKIRKVALPINGRMFGILSYYPLHPMISEAKMKTEGQGAHFVQGMLRAALALGIEVMPDPPQDKEKAGDIPF